MRTRELYQAEFEDIVFAGAPRSVCDIGCGDGDFLGRALARGIHAAGVEPEAKRAVTCRDSGLDVHEASAELLPFKDASFDAVVCERSAHHFADLAKGLAEALRVARLGVHIFDPWFDETIPSQAAAAAIERWEKRVDTARGHVNNGPLCANDFLRALPKAAGLGVEITHRLILSPLSLEHVAGDTAAMLEGWDGAQPFRAELDALLANAHATSLTEPGAIFVVVKKP